MRLTNLSPRKAGWLVAAAVMLNVAAEAANIEYPGWIKVENFDDVPGGQIIDLQNSPKFTNNQPTSVTFVNSLYYSRSPGADAYGSRISGFITNQESAERIFYVAADDSCSFYLSTDATPANLKLVAADQGWQNSRTWTGGGGTSSGDGTTNVVYRRGYNPGPDALLTNGFVWVGPFENRSDQFLNSPRTNLVTSPSLKWPTTDGSGNAKINLVAGQKYYFELLFKEGGGGENAGVAWTKAGDPDPANNSAEIDGSVLSVIWADSLSFTAQPTNQTVAVSQLVTFYTRVLGVPGDADTTLFTYQWFSNNIAITDGTGNGANYTIVSTTLGMDGSKYKVQATSAGTSPAGVIVATSAEATLHVIVDNTPPKISKIVSSETFAAAKITFSEAVQNEAVDPTKYVFGGGLTVTDANFDLVADIGSEDPKNPINPLNRVSVILFTSTQTEGASYPLTVNSVKDLVGNNLTPNTITMYANVFRPGILTYHKWQSPPGSGGPNINNVNALSGNQLQLENPLVTGLLTSAETAPFDNGASGNYVSRASGYFIPAKTTNYVFLFSADNNGFVYLSTDANPANRKLICADVGWQNNRTWTGPGGDTSKRRGDGVGGGPFENRSDEFLTSTRATSGGGLPGGPVLPADGIDPEPWPTTNVNGNAVITLTAGTKYYIQLWHEEFEGGRVEATMKIAGEADPVNGSVSTIGSALIGGLVDPTTVPPLLSISGTTITFSGRLLSSATANGTYLPVAGATSPYTVPAPKVGNQFYRAVFP